MVVYSILILVTTLLGLYAEKHRNVQYVVVRGINNKLIRIDRAYLLGMIPIIVILSFVSAVRDGVGIDYDSYVMFIDMIQKNLRTHMEIGFVQVSLLLAKINTDPRLVIIAFGVATTVLFVKAIWEQSDNIGYSIFLFLTWGYYFVTFNTIRNYFALALIVYGIKYLRNNKTWHFLVCCLLAATIHKSALVCIPFYLLARERINFGKYAFYSAICFLCIILKKYMRIIAFSIYPSYLGTEYDIGRISYLNIIKAIGVIIICLFCFDSIKNSKQYSFYFNLNFYSLLLYIGLYWLPEISRIGFYFNIIDIFLVPIAMEESKKRRSGRVIVLSVIIMSLILFGLLCIQFSAPSSGVLPYKTWLFK